MSEIAAVLDELVPDVDDAFGDWTDVLRRAGIVAASEPAGAPGRRRPRRLLLGLAVIGLVLVVLFATPAFGLLRDLIGRTNVPFTGKKAPYHVRRDFFDMSLSAPAGMNPQAISSQTRRVAVFHVDGKSHVLYVAPTRQGGFCWIFVGGVGGCRNPRNVDRSGITAGWSGNGTRVVSVSGYVLSPRTQHLHVDYADGTHDEIPFTWVSKPIAAGFFFHAVPAGHTAATAVRGVSAWDGDGHRIANAVIGVPPRPLHIPPPHPTPPSSYRRGTLPAPAAPVQRGSAGGVTVTVGANRVAEFDLAGANASVRKLIASPGRGLACFKFVRYHEVAPFEMGGTGLGIAKGDRISLNGLPAPYDGCEVQGGYGHTWPDRNGSHSAVEIPFTARARHFFADRAAARDLALYVRSRAHHGLDGITALVSSTAPLPADTIGFVRGAAGTTYVERSTTGKRFAVTVLGTKVTRQNVKPYAFVF